MLLGTLAASYLGSALTGWGVIRPGKKKKLKLVKIFDAVSSVN